MSFMETNMFGQHIWGSKLPREVVAVAKRSGWNGADLTWEQLQEEANSAYSEGDIARAARMFRRAHWLAIFRFARTDLRRATSLANLGILDMYRSRISRGQSRLRKALALWECHARDAVETMQIAPRARSSLFHLRMEALHRDTYHTNLKLRIGKIAEETRESLQAHLDGQPCPHRHFDRWKGERPTVYDDTRKVLAACLMLVEPR